MESGTYTQLYIHVVFAVKYRKASIDDKWAPRLRQYITAVVQDEGHKMISINNMPDHIHIFFGLKPSQSISQLMQAIKGHSSAWINKEKLTVKKFNWQTGYGAFSYSRSQIKNVARYIENQQEHHRKTNFIDEYKTMLNKFSVAFDERYIFKEMED